MPIDKPDLTIWLCDEDRVRLDAFTAAVNTVLLTDEPQLPDYITAPSTPRELVLDEIDSERDRQDLKYGGPAHDDLHGIGDWLDLISERVGECWDDLAGRHERELFVQIAALAVAAVESGDRCNAWIT